MTEESWIKERLVAESWRVRSDKTYTGVIEDNRMDAFIIDSVLHELAKIYGFSNFAHMNRFMTPDTKARSVVYVGQERRKPPEKGPDR